LTAQLTNEETTFIQSASVNFINSKCKWLTVSGDKGKTVKESYTVFAVSPATDDISFTLSLERDPTLDCSSFDFFNSFFGLDFDFIMTDTADYISYSPNMVIVAYNSETNMTLSAGDVAPTKMNINVTMPKSEQEKLPVFQDIVIMMTARWTSASFKYLQMNDTVFQNLLYTIKFEPKSNVLFA